MKLTKSVIRDIILEVLKEEDLEKKKPVPPKPKPAAKPPAPKSDDSGGDSKELKIDIPDSPFTPDASQILGQLKHILKQWEIKKYPSDEVRWKEYYKDIANLFKKVKGEANV